MPDQRQGGQVLRQEFFWEIFLKMLWVFFLRLFHMHTGCKIQLFLKKARFREYKCPWNALCHVLTGIIIQIWIKFRRTAVESCPVMFCWNHWKYRPSVFYSFIIISYSLDKSRVWFRWIGNCIKKSICWFHGKINCMLFFYYGACLFKRSLHQKLVNGCTNKFSSLCYGCINIFRDSRCQMSDDFNCWKYVIISNKNLHWHQYICC